MEREHNSLTVLVRFDLGMDGAVSLVALLHKSPQLFVHSGGDETKGNHTPASDPEAISLFAECHFEGRKLSVQGWTPSGCALRWSGRCEKPPLKQITRTVSLGKKVVRCLDPRNWGTCTQEVFAEVVETVIAPVTQRFPQRPDAGNLSSASAVSRTLVLDAVSVGDQMEILLRV